MRQLPEDGRSLDDTVHEGVMSRLRPIRMTALLASFGLTRIAMATGIGAGFSDLKRLSSLATYFFSN